MFALGAAVPLITKALDISWALMNSRCFFEELKIPDIEGVLRLKVSRWTGAETCCYKIESSLAEVVPC